MNRTEELDKNEPASRAGRDTDSANYRGNKTDFSYKYKDYTRLWTAETERMMIEEIVEYVESAGDKASAEDFLEKLPWVFRYEDFTQEHIRYLDDKIHEILETGEATPEYGEPKIPKIRRHRFKPAEWLYITERQELVDLLIGHKNEFNIAEWHLEDIEYFLHLQHWIYPEAHYQRHHVRACATIIREEGVL